MSTIIRPELSTRNRYWIDRHRYYELKHFCLQYPAWKKLYANAMVPTRPKSELLARSRTSPPSDPTARCAETRLYFADRIQLVERVATETAPDLSTYILKGVTEGVSYDCLRARLDIPCCKDTYYNLYRRFFWLLNRERQ